MLSEKRKTQLVDAVEEEIQDLEKYPYVCTSKVGVFNYGEYQVQIVVTRDEEEMIDVGDDEEE